MFQSAEVGHSVSKEEFAREVPRLREKLLAAQEALRENGKFGVLIVIGGVDGAGKGETVNVLNEWMDPRHIRTVGFGAPSDEESERPHLWRFWRELPPKGKVGIFFGSWYTEPIVGRVEGRLSAAELEREAESITRLERMLTDEGMLVVKFWFHLSKAAQKKRLKELEKNARTRWRVTDADWKRFEHYDEFRTVSEAMLRETSSGHAPWIVVEGTDARYRYLTVGRILLEALERRLAQTDEQRRPKAAAPLVPAIDNTKFLRDLDLATRMAEKKYEKELEEKQGRLNVLCRAKSFRKKSAVLVFEGVDAAGKGGAVRRVTGALDARQYHVIPVAAPTEEERAQPYLWRFWRHLPRHGHVTIFDRSWYGRVLVERVEGFCSEADWMRAYSEINDFEEQLVEHDVVLCKFWLHISQAEQLRRFKEREKTGFKKFKITEEDWRNRKKWGAYERAIADMVDRTSTDLAPWTIVPAEDKHLARIRVLDTVVKALERAK